MRSSRKQSKDKSKSNDKKPRPRDGKLSERSVKNKKEVDSDLVNTLFYPLPLSVSKIFIINLERRHEKFLATFRNLLNARVDPAKVVRVIGVDGLKFAEVEKFGKFN